MQKIFVIGTIHGCTPDKELREILEGLSPDQLLIELPDDALERFDDNKDVRTEMMFAYQWAKKRGTSFYFFDEYQSLFKEGVSPESSEYKKFIEEDNRGIEKYSWKDFNKSEISKELDSPLMKKLFDPKKAKLREEKMLAKIKEHMIPDGNVVIITGTSHLDFFQVQLPNAMFPLRD